MLLLCRVCVDLSRGTSGWLVFFAVYTTGGVYLVLKTIFGSGVAAVVYLSTIVGHC